MPLFQARYWLPLGFTGDARRTIQVPSQITDQILELLRNKNEFTFMASIQQKAFTSGVFFSIHESEH
ncbi:protein kinase C-binding protein NELL1 isoform X1, partial [Tachysurus ichikawai]